MRRNKAISKRVMEAVRDLDTSNGVSIMHVILRCKQAGDAPEDIQSAIDLLKTSGYLIERISILRLTWSGHDLLESLSVSDS